MILWIASYPKSGNTLLRAMISAYFYSKDGNFNFNLLKNIKQFPDESLFKNLNIKISNELEVVKNYIKVQEEINKRDGNIVRFLKTHSSLNDINGFKFTDIKNSLGVIYIVRNPKKVLISYANHSDISLEESKKRILETRIIGGKNDPLNKVNIHTGSWSSNYNTWKEFKKINRYLLVKFEDLTEHPEKTFLLIINFIQNLIGSKLPLNKKKLENVLKTTSFNHLQNLEKKIGFTEATLSKDKKKVQFFKYGKNNNALKELPNNILKELSIKLNKEMTELDYL